MTYDDLQAMQLNVGPDAANELAMGYVQDQRHYVAEMSAGLRRRRRQRAVVAYGLFVLAVAVYTVFLFGVVLP